MSIGILGIVFVLFALAMSAVAIAAFVWWLVVLIEAVRIPDAQWAAADQNKLLHVLLMVVLGVVGTIIYVVAARPALRRVAYPV